jgi:hypothetical protein
MRGEGERGGGGATEQQHGDEQDCWSWTRGEPVRHQEQRCAGREEEMISAMMAASAGSADLASGAATNTIGS